MSSIEHLLTPSLSGKGCRPMYSTFSHVVVAFVSGPAGLFLYSLNSVHHAKQLQRFRLWYLLFFVLVLISQYWVFYVITQGSVFSELLKQDPEDIAGVSNRLISMILLGFSYLIQKDVYKISEFTGDRPSPWIPGIICVVLGLVTTSVVIFGGLVYV